MLPLDEAYAVVRSGAGVVVARPGRGLLRLTGPQRVWFLQNTVTADVDDVAPGRWVESFFLDVKGHPVAHFRAGFLTDEVWLDVDPPATPDLLDWFTRYRFRTKVEIEDRSAECHTILGAACEDGAVDAQGPSFGGRLGEVPALDVYAAAFSSDMPQAPPELYDLLRVEAGIARFGVDYGPANLPQEAGLTRIVSVSKGCYVGQEVMARIHFRGHANRCARRLELHDVDGDVTGRSLALDGAAVGAVTSSVVSPGLGPLGIGMVRLTVPEGAVLDVEGGGTAVAGPVPEGTKVV